MPAGATQFSPRVLKDNLRATLGDFIHRNRLGQYLDFNVVVIPTGKHMTKFPTADAAFHPFEGDSGTDSDDGALEIRVVPWLITKITANEQQSEALNEEMRMFWMAGVKEVWELAPYAWELRSYFPDGKKVVYKGTDLVPQPDVLPGFIIYVSQLFYGIDDEQTVLPESDVARGDGWHMPLVEAEEPKSRLQKSGAKSFTAAPDTDARDVYRDAADGGAPKNAPAPGLGTFLKAAFSSWPVRIFVALIAGLVIGTIIQLASGTRNQPAPELSKNGDRQSKEERAGILGELAKQTIRDFLQEDTVDGKLAHVRNPETVRPMMEEFYRRGWGKLRPQTVRLFGSVETFEIGAETWYRTEVRLDPENGVANLEPVKEKDGKFLLDWPSFVGFNKPSLGETLEVMPEEPVSFRVRATFGDKGSGYFPPEDFQEVVLNFPLEEMVILGYIDRDAVEFPRLESLIKGEYQFPLKLSIKWPKGRKKKDEVEIVAIDGEDWLIEEN